VEVTYLPGRVQENVPEFTVNSAIYAAFDGLSLTKLRYACIKYQTWW